MEGSKPLIYLATFCDIKATLCHAEVCHITQIILIFFYTYFRVFEYRNRPGSKAVMKDKSDEWV